jgi:hypothetical protein
LECGGSAAAFTAEGIMKKQNATARNQNANPSFFAFEFCVSFGMTTETGTKTTAAGAGEARLVVT